MAECRLRLVLDAVVKGLDDVFFKVLGAWIRGVDRFAISVGEFRVGDSKRLLLHSRGVAVPMSSHPIVVALFSLQPFFFNDLQEGGALLGPWGSISPRNPIRAQRESAQLQDAQARAQTLLQRSHPCVEDAC